jgi:hypothetical protein
MPAGPTSTLIKRNIAQYRRLPAIISAKICTGDILQTSSDVCPNDPINFSCPATTSSAIDEDRKLSFLGSQSNFDKATKGKKKQFYISFHRRSFTPKFCRSANTSKSNLQPEWVFRMQLRHAVIAPDAFSTWSRVFPLLDKDEWPSSQDPDPESSTSSNCWKLNKYNAQ